jgi:hypothetical protein
MQFDEMQDIPEVFQVSAMMALSCTSHPFETAYTMINEQCTVKDINILEEVDNFLGHGLEPVKNACTNKIPVYKEVDGLSYAHIMKKWEGGSEAGTSYVTDLMQKYNYPVPNEVTQEEINLFLETIGIIVNELCGHKILINLDGGEGFALPFRFSRESVLSAITFGDTGLSADKFPKHA